MKTKMPLTAITNIINFLKFVFQIIFNFFFRDLLNEIKEFFGELSKKYSIQKIISSLKNYFKFPSKLIFLLISWWPSAFFALIALFMVLLVGDGIFFLFETNPYVQPLNLVFYDITHSPSLERIRALPQDFVLNLPYHLFGLELGQKVQLFLLIFLCGWLAYKFSFLVKSKRSAFVFGLIYLINPFVVGRLVTGQFEILAAYILVPVVVYFIIDFLERGKNLTLLFLGFCSSLIAAFSPHFFVIVFGLVLPILLVGKFFSEKNFVSKNNFVFILKRIFGLVVALILSNGAFFLQFLFKANTLVLSITYSQFFNFALLPEAWANPLFAGLSLSGFWAYYFPLFRLLAPEIFLILFWFFLSVVVFGFFVSKKWFKGSLLVIGIFCLLLGVGVSSFLSRPLTDFLFNFPFFSGFRDSSKFIGILALVYACFVSSAFEKAIIFIEEFIFGVWSKFNVLLKIKVNSFFVFLNKFFSLFVFPVCSSFFSFNGIRFFVSVLLIGSIFCFPFLTGLFSFDSIKSEFFGRPVFSEINEVKSFLDSQSGEFNIFIVPHLGYDSFSWAKGVYKNPLTWAFGRKNLGIFERTGYVSKPIAEINSIYNSSSSLAQSRVIEIFSENNVRFVVVSSDGSFENYTFISKLRKVFVSSGKFFSVYSVK